MLLYFTRAFLVIRLFSTYHNFRLGDLDLELWITYTKCCDLNLVASRRTLLSSGSSCKWIACKCREIQRMFKKFVDFVSRMLEICQFGAKSRDYPQNGRDLTCMQAIYILILSSSVQFWLVWLDITYVTMVTGTVGARPYTGMLHRVYTWRMEVLLWLHQNQLPGKFSIVDKDWMDNHIIINVTISAHDIVFCTPELTLN